MLFTAAQFEATQVPLREHGFRKHIILPQDLVLGFALPTAGIRSGPSSTALIIMQNLKDAGIIKLSYNQGHI